MNSLNRRLDVLVVDDDPGDVLLISEALQAAGHTQAIHVAGDGLQALAYLHRTGHYADAARPDIVFLDLNMPRKDGRQVLAEIKADPHLTSIPVIVLTTSSDAGDIADSYTHQANAFICKPPNLDDLPAVIANIDDFFTCIAALPQYPHAPSGERRS